MSSFWHNNNPDSLPADSSYDDLREVYRRMDINQPHQRTRLSGVQPVARGMSYNEQSYAPFQQYYSHNYSTETNPYTQSRYPRTSYPYSNHQPILSPQTSAQQQQQPQRISPNLPIGSFSSFPSHPPPPPPLRSRRDNLPDSQLLRDINTTSADALLHEWPMNIFRAPDTSKVNLSVLLRGCLCKHRTSGFETTSMNRVFDDFLIKRGDLIKKHYELLKKLKEKEERQNSNPRKRSFMDLVISDSDSTKAKGERAENLVFIDLTAQPCSFFRPGIVFQYKNKFEVEIGDVNFRDSKLSGSISFKDEADLTAWLKRYKFGYQDIKRSRSSKSSSVIKGKLEFQGDIVDFGKTDLRYVFQEGFENIVFGDNYSTPEYQVNIMRKTNGFHSIFSNVIVKRQLSRWMKMVPFCSMTLNDFVPVLTCEHCLQTIQSRYIFMKLSLCDIKQDEKFADMKPPGVDFLSCLDRETGEFQMVIVSDTWDDIKLVMIQERVTHGPMDYDNKLRRINNKAFKLQLQNKHYESDSFKLA